LLEHTLQGVSQIRRVLLYLNQQNRPPFHSQAPKAVDAWRGELQNKSRPKIAASVAHPDVNADLFEEGWGDALVREKESNTCELH